MAVHFQEDIKMQYKQMWTWVFAVDTNFHWRIQAFGVGS